MAKNKKKYYLTPLGKFTIIVIIALISFSVLKNRITASSSENTAKNQSKKPEVTQVIADKDDVSETDISPEKVDLTEPYPIETASTACFSEDINSKYGVLVDIKNNTVLATRNGNDKIYPASLTKIMTLVVAVESLKSEDLNDTFTMTYEILNPLINADASRAGFSENESVRVVDMLYGSILPSGADATVGLATYISGDEENFVALMNEKAEQIGLKNTHFTNTSGLFNENHYSTATDMAVILKYALKNDLCREILSTYQYKTQPTEQHPDGILLTSNMFSRMYGNEVEGVKICGGKTGYVIESGNCLATFAEKNGNEYITITTNGGGRYQPIYDSFEIYKRYLP